MLLRTSPRSERVATHSARTASSSSTSSSAASTRSTQTSWTRCGGNGATTLELLDTQYDKYDGSSEHRYGPFVVVANARLAINRRKLQQWSLEHGTRAVAWPVSGCSSGDHAKIANALGPSRYFGPTLSDYVSNDNSASLPAAPAPVAALAAGDEDQERDDDALQDDTFSDSLMEFFCEGILGQLQVNKSPAHGLANGTTAVMHHLTWDTAEKAAAAQKLIDNTPHGSICYLPLCLRPSHLVVAFRPRATIPNAPECSNQRFGVLSHPPRPEPVVDVTSSNLEE